MEYFTLNNGLRVPALGTGPGSAVGWDHVRLFGNSRIGNKLNRVATRARNKRRRMQWKRTLIEQLRMGYRLIDHSIAYGDEFLIHQAIQESGIAREEVILASRFSNVNLYRDNLRTVFKQTKASLGDTPIDLFGFHWPVPEHYMKAYRLLEELYRDGEIRAISVCNCHEHHLERILQECDVVPAINQVEVHPLFTQKPLIDYCKKQGIVVQAYTPLARNDERLRKVRAITEVAEKYAKTPSQIILRWHVQSGTLAIPRSLNPMRYKQNISIFDFILTECEMRAIDAANINSRLRYSPDNCDFTQL